MFVNTVKKGLKNYMNMRLPVYVSLNSFGMQNFLRLKIRLKFEMLLNPHL